MSFDVTPEAYDRFMGRFSTPLADPFVDFVGVRPGQRALDVGCGTGALTEVLVDRLGADAVVAVDPSAPFVAAVRRWLPDVEVHRAAAEALPLPDDCVDVALAQLVVHFMADPVAGVREMARVTRPGGLVATCVWDHGGGTGPLSAFWGAARELDPAVAGEAGLTGSTQGDLEDVATQAGLHGLRSTRLTVQAWFPTFDEWWEPFTLGVGPAGGYVAGLSPEQVAALRDRCATRLPAAPFGLEVAAWAVTGQV